MGNFKKYASLCILSLCFSLISCKRGFLLTSPKKLDCGSTEYLAITLTDVSKGGHVAVTLLNSHTHEAFASSIIFAHNNQNTWIPLKIPDVDYSIATLVVNGNFSDGYRINERREVEIRRQSMVTFIQTDKPIYKPGQTVQFRILTMNSQLVPLTGQTIGDLWIEDPSGIRVSQWKQVDLSDGMIQMSLPLSDDPVKGTWIIKSIIRNLTQIQTFEVDEYVLPKFEVQIYPPSYVMADAESILVKICAKYTYGEKVHGLLNAKMTYQRSPFKDETYFPVVEFEGLISGCTDFLVDANQLLLNQKAFGFRTLQVFAKVAEKGTGILQNASKTIEISHQPLTMKFLGIEERSYYFKPGLPYTGKVRILKPDGKVAPSESIKVCAIREARENTRKIPSLCNEFLSDKDGVIKFTIPAQNSKVDRIVLKVTADSPKVMYDSWNTKIHQPSLSLTIRPWYSPSGSYLQIEPLATAVVCGHLEKVRIQYTTQQQSSINFYHQVISRGRIVQLGLHSRSFLASNQINDIPDDEDEQYTLKTSEHESDLHMNSTLLTYTSDFTFALDAKSSMSPLARLLVFYIRDDGEIVADSKAFKINHCLSNQVKLLFRHSEQYPSTEAAVLLSASPSSLCGITFVDKSIHLMGREQKFSKSKVFQLLETYDVGKDLSTIYDYKKNCEMKVFDSLDNYGEYDGDLKRRKRSIFPGILWRYEDASTAFDDAGTIVITDMLLKTAPCLQHESISQGYSYLDPAQRIYYSPPKSEKIDSSKKMQKEANEIRSYFPETWLWEMHRIGENGEMALKRELPDTITEWLGEAVCIHPEQGLGISDTAKIVAFQPFFASFNLPYSVIRGETVAVVISVFNYLTECLQITLSLERSDSYKVTNDSRDRRLCVCGGESETSKFLIYPLIVGSVNITVYAYTDSEEKICGNQVTARISARDAVTRQLLVEAEGFQKEETFNHFVCPQSSNGSYIAEVNLFLPEHVVKDSERAYMSATGDLMGPALSGFEHLVRMPTGCGEQNMVIFTPIVHIMDYLSTTNQITNEMNQKMGNYLQKGYQREFKYRHSDSSYSAFGSSDNEGNTWLTAFVVRSFAQAARFITIDEENLNLSVLWLVQKQLENGCFMPVGNLLNKALQGGLRGSQSLAPLTAYVLISLFEAKVNLTEVTNSALYCLEGDENPSIYSLSLFAYATALAGKQNLALRYLQELEDEAIKSDNIMHWEYDGGNNNAINVEIAGYYILALLQLKGSDNFIEALPVVRWIASQRTPNGGFVSTQDTVVALQALSKYSSFVSSEEINMELAVESDDLKQYLTVNSSNKLLMQTLKIPTLPSIVDLQATGRGCALVQFSLKYNVDNTAISDAFDLKIEASRRGSFGCNLPAIAICMRYRIPNEVSNMVVLEVKMVSGYVVDESNLQKLKQDPTVQLKRFEVVGNSVNFYFDQLNNEQKCFRFFVKNEIEVTNEKEASVKLYDYYQPELEMTTSYSISANCLFTPLPDFPRLLPMVFTDESIKEYPHEITNSEKIAELPILTTETLTSTADVNDEERMQEDSNGGIQNYSPFVDVDEDLNFPDGIEGNKPTYVLPPNCESHHQCIRVTNCPICTSEYLSNFTDLYCSTELALKLRILNFKKGKAKILQDISPCRTIRKLGKFKTTLVMDSSCNCSHLKKNGIINVLTQNDQLYKLERKLHLQSQTYIFDESSFDMHNTFCNMQPGYDC